MATENRTDYITTYTPSLLEPIARDDQRLALGITGDKLPFKGMDIWRAYEFTWLNSRGKPEVAVADFQIPSKSKNLEYVKEYYLHSWWHIGTSISIFFGLNELLICI